MEGACWVESLWGGAIACWVARVRSLAIPGWYGGLAARTPCAPRAVILPAVQSLAWLGGELEKFRSEEK
jgi:hypothetical protein